MLTASDLTTLLARRLDAEDLHEVLAEAEARSSQTRTFGMWGPRIKELTGKTVAEQTLRNHVASGIGPAHDKFGNRLYATDEQLLAYVEARSEKVLA